MAIEIPVIGNMQGSSGRLSQNNGENAFIRPSQQRIKLEYINIQNTTENTLKIFGLYDDVLSSFPTYQIGGRMAISLKLTQKLSEGVIITFNNPDPTTNDQIKPLEIIWSDTSKGWNASLAPSYVSDYVGQNVNVINTPKVTIDNEIDVNIINTPNIIVSNIPHIIVDSGELNIIRDYVIPLSDSKNNSSLVLTAPSIVSKNNYCSYISYNTKGGVIGGADVDITIKDGATIIYSDVLPIGAISGQKEYISFNPPLVCSTNSPLTFSIDASGTIGTIINGNMGYFNK